MPTDKNAAQMDVAAIKSFLEGRQLRLQSGCKINLFLRLTGVRPDGYHTLETFFVPLREPHDEILLSRATGAESADSDVPSLFFSSSDPDIDPDNNTLQKVFTLYRQSMGKAARPLPSIRLHLEKGVPHGAGLGGSSANAAVFLLFLDALTRSDAFPGLGEAGLHDLAVRVGADVPFFLRGEPARASGIGEKLTLSPNPYAGYFLLLVWPGIRVSTPWAYKAWDSWQALAAETISSVKVVESLQDDMDVDADFDTKSLTNFGTPGSYSVLRGLKLRNDFEASVMSAYPQVALLKRQLLNNGAEAALMSGSGSAVFGLFEDESKARAALELVRQSHSFAYLQRI